jgi:hypothetical protein
MVNDATAVAATTGVAQVFDLHALKDFASDKRRPCLTTYATWATIGS